MAQLVKPWPLNPNVSGSNHHLYKMFLDAEITYKKIFHIMEVWDINTHRPVVRSRLIYFVTTVQYYTTGELGQTDGGTPSGRDWLLSGDGVSPSSTGVPPQTSRSAAGRPRGRDELEAAVGALGGPPCWGGAVGRPGSVQKPAERAGKRFPGGPPQASRGWRGGWRPVAAGPATAATMAGLLERAGV